MAINRIKESNVSLFGWSRLNAYLKQASWWSLKTVVITRQTDLWVVTEKRRENSPQFTPTNEHEIESKPNETNKRTMPTLGCPQRSQRPQWAAARVLLIKYWSEHGHTRCRAAKYTTIHTEERWGHTLSKALKFRTIDLFQHNSHEESR